MSDSATRDGAASRWLRRALWALLALCLAGVLGLGATVLVLLPQLPDTSSLANYQPKQPLRVYTADGVEIGGFGNEKREYLRIQQFPQMMRDSLLAVEDSRFYEHPGIDVIGVLRAIVANATGGRTQGASTITQQVARTFFLTRERTLSRKLKEALLSLRIEQQLSKDQILELYMNQIYLGARTYGFAEASRTYFGKPIQQLSVAECAMLAGLPQNPAYANPIKSPKRAKDRQLVVLSRMRAEGVIDDIVYAAAKAEKLYVRNPGEMDVHGEYVAEMARAQVYAQYGESAYTSGMKVVTTLRAADQQAGWKAVRKTLIDRELRLAWRGPEAQEDLPADLSDQDPAIAQLLTDHDDDETLRVAIVTQASSKRVTAVLASGDVVVVSGKGLRQALPGLGAKARANQRVTRGSVVRLLQVGQEWVITQWPQAEGALVAMDPHDGRIRALVGGFDFHRNQFNHVTQGWRQPGSTYKPFLYSAALENGVMPETLINDAPLSDVGNWTPSNADGSAEGPIPLHIALAKSKNLVSIRLVQLMGPEAARQWTGHFGFDVDKQPANLTLALGSGSTTVMQMASAYAVIANGGLSVNPVLIQKIQDGQGKVVFEAKPTPADESQRVIPARNAFVTSTLLNEVARSGTAAKAQAQLRRPDLYGKTGTTNDVVDAWFAGFQPNLVAVVWFGHDTPRSLGSQASGGSLALPAWIQFMGTALRGEPVRSLSTPEGVVSLPTGWRYSEWAEGGFLTELGVDETPIDRSLIPTPPLPGASEPEGEDTLRSFIERLFN
ncbi:MAG: PBP1A family penicillin-binding protein [Aquabacterium sp.]|jgi:penicillin-binding protein 1A|uniref:penicillin-binding protein 1A n=1 Tax=Aquabacterium sp. TaxID=1872578 RepID=UPI002A36BCE9|nr:PBP1A family penicillin-binding protein [Aquabacterium sp.]MDX9844081.1 PBP1A family penicillin-binding protein [Aquabacterium sp.]